MAQPPWVQLFYRYVPYSSRTLLIAVSRVNFFSGAPLNRLSWLRPKTAFLNEILKSPSTQWMLFRTGQPLVSSGSIVYLSTRDVEPLLGEHPYFGQGQAIGDSIQEETTHTEALRHRGPPIVFLGLHEPEGSPAQALAESDFLDTVTAVKNLEGRPLFSIDVGNLDAHLVDQTLESSELARNGSSLVWGDPRAVMATLSMFDAAIFAEARGMVDWNTRTQFCAGCGSRVASLWAGWKLVCTSLLPWATEGEGHIRRPCPTNHGLHNFTHPRTDAVVIMIAIDQTGDKILLGHSRKFPGKFYSALAGFIEPGESFEDAVKREMWEEAGVKVWDVAYHSSQPWPYPANLMVGFWARADSTQPIRTDLDNELIDAKWFTRDQVLQAFKDPLTTSLPSRKELKKISDEEEGRVEPRPNGEAALAHSDPNVTNTKTTQANNNADGDEVFFRLPPAKAIAGVLIKDWAEGKIRVDPTVEVVMPKGAL